MRSSASLRSHPLQGEGWVGMVLAAHRQTFARHSGERLRSSFRRTPESSSFLLTSFPRKRESMLTLFFEVQGFHSPCGRAGHFLYSGHPALRRFAASFAVRAAPAAQCLCKESNQRNTPPVARSPGILPSECASRFRGALSAHPCAHSARARFLRAPLRAFPPPARRATGGPVWAASCRRSNRSRLLLPRQVSMRAHDRIKAVQGCTDSWIAGAVRGAEHRRRGGKMPAGSRRWIAAIAKQYMDVLSEQPRLAEKRRAVRFARCESDRRVRCLAFLVTFWAMPKSNRLARRARRSSALKEHQEQRSWIPA